jgi:hypothetical protein
MGTRSGNLFHRTLIVATLSSVLCWIVPSCGNDDGGLYCCMLRQLADHCTSSYDTSSLSQAVSNWRDVGNSGNAEACKALVDGQELGCYGNVSADFTESDAIALCSR